MSQKSLTSNPPAEAVVRDIRGARRRLLVAARLSADARFGPSLLILRKGVYHF